MKTQYHSVFKVILFLTLVFPLISHAQGTAISLKAGSLGLGFEATRTIFQNLNGRVAINYFSYNYNGESKSGDVNYDLDFNLLSFTVFFDWFPFESGFHLSGGFLYSNNNIEGLGKPTRTYTVGGTIYTPEKLGNLNAKVEPSLKFSPYLGLGWGNAVEQDKKLGFLVNLGIIYQGSPDVTLTAKGLLEPTAEQEPDVENDIRNLKYYPVLTIGLTYQF
ncbi:MAG: hypothetical protein PVH88_00800 [Ignavibacteria bacterium]